MAYKKKHSYEDHNSFYLIYAELLSKIISKDPGSNHQNPFQIVVTYRECTNHVHGNSITLNPFYLFLPFY